MIPNINSGANIIIYYQSEQIVFMNLYIVHILENHVKSITCTTGLTWAENRSDMECE